MSGIRVLVTRPQPGADRTAVRLAYLGYAPVLLPLTQTVALAQKLPAAKPNLVVATSPKAFFHLSEELRDMLTGVPVAVTGEGSAAAARNAGLTHVEAAGGNVAGLVDRLGRSILPATRVLYLAGRVRRPDLELFLQGSAAKFDLIEAYDTISVSYSTEKLRQASAGGSFSSALLTSVETVAALAGISNVDFTHAIEFSIFICLSERIAEAARNKFNNPIAVAVEPTEDGLMDCLIKTVPRI